MMLITSGVRMRKAASGGSGDAHSTVRVVSRFLVNGNMWWYDPAWAQRSGHGRVSLERFPAGADYASPAVR